MVEVRKKVENGQAHYEIFVDGKFVESCDPTELHTTLREEYNIF